MATHRAKSRNSTAPTLVRLAASRRAHENDTTSSSDSEVDSDQARNGKNKKRNSHEKSKAKGKKSKKEERMGKGKADKPCPDQIVFYKGDTRTILENVKLALRVFLATVNAFPTVEQLLRVVRKAFPKACKDVIGHFDGGDMFMFSPFLLLICTFNSQIPEAY